MVRLSDVADVVLGAEDYDTAVAFTGETAVFVGIWALPNANSLDVIKKIRVELAAIQKELPAQITATMAYDATEYIQSAIDDVVRTLRDTLLIVVIVIFLFLGSFRSVLVPVVAIPVSLIGAVFLMQVFGFTLNLLTLLAIVLSVGLVVDDAIVVVENVERHLSEGKTPLQAALIGARELVGPIIAMTITLAAVYVPIAFQGGLTGSLFREFALTLAGAVTISGVVALTLSPMMSRYLLHAGGEHEGFAGVINRGFDRIRQTYGRWLEAALSSRRIVYTAWAVFTVLFVLMFQMAVKELAPAEDQGFLFGIVNTPANSTLDQLAISTAAVHKTVIEVPESKFTFQVTNPGGGFWGVGLKPWDQRKRTTAQVLPDIQQRVSMIPGVETFAVLPPALPGGGTFPVEFVIASTAEEIGDPRLRQAAPAEGRGEREVLVPPADRREDRPAAVGDRHRPGEGRAAEPQSPAGRSGSGRGRRRELRQPVQHPGPELQGHSPAAPDRAPQPRAADRHLRHRAERAAGQALLDRHGEGHGGAALAQPLPAAQRGEDQRRGPVGGRRAQVPRGPRRPRSCPRATRSTTPASRGSSGWRGTSSSPHSRSRWC